jgi:hypothetical protein
MPRVIKGSWPPTPLYDSRGTSTKHGRPQLSVQDFGDAEKMVTNKPFMKRRVQMVVQSDTAHHKTNWAGWLGRYETALAAEARVAP